MKSKLKYVYLLTLLAFACWPSSAQNKGRTYFMDELKIKSSNSRIEQNKYGQAILVSEYRGENVKLQSRMDMDRTYLGTPYFNDQWFKGNMSFRGGNDVTGVMAYNVVNNILYYSLNENVEAVEVQPDKFTLANTTFQKFDHLYNGTGDFYYELLYDGEPKLLKQHLGKFVPASNSEGGSYGANPDGEYEGSFTKTAKYYFVVQKQMILVRNKSKFFKALEPYTKQAKDICIKDELDLRVESDIIALVKSLGNSHL